MKTEQPLLITTIKHQFQNIETVPRNRAIAYDGELADETMVIAGISNAEVPAKTEIPVMCAGIALCRTYDTSETYTPGMDIAVRIDGKVGPVSDPTSKVGKCMDSVTGAGILIRVKLNT